MTPEALARQDIDQLLAAGWEIQDRAAMALFGRPGRGVAVREAPLKSGPAETVLRGDGLSYGDYVEQLTYLFFLRMDDARRLIGDATNIAVEIVEALEAALEQFRLIAEDLGQET